MKGIYLIAIAFLAPWTVTATQNETIGTLDRRCPVEDTCPPIQFFHENECTMYYECKGGYPELRHCANGLHFSKKWMGCVRPSASECRIGQIGECRNGELLEHECECTKFYECINGWKALRNCQSGWHFDKIQRTCIEGTDCNSPNPGTCREGDLIVHECQCDKYYVCKRGRKALRECEIGTIFDPYLSGCVPGSCDRKRMCTNGQQRSHECSCKNYYNCKNEEWIMEECRYGYHFSPHFLTCLPEREAKCERQFGECPTPTPTGPWPHECDCRLYYTCRNGQKEIQFCSWGNYYDSAAMKCNSAKNVRNCKNHWDDWL